MEVDGEAENLNPSSAAGESKVKRQKVKEGNYLLGSPTFVDLGDGRWRCEETGHDVPAKAKKSYSRTKACRLALIDAALAKKSPLLNTFQPHPISKSMLVCSLTGDVINKSEEHIWKHINGRRFLKKLGQMENIPSTLTGVKQTKRKFFLWNTNPEWIPGLLQIMCEYVDANMRSAQGFKDIVYKGVSQKLKEKFGIDVTAEQCKNQIRHQRHLWSHIQNLKRKSGVSWDETSKMILIGHEEYMSHIQAFPKDACYLNVPIPNYAELEKVCGEGHATGDWSMSTSSQVSFTAQVNTLDEDETSMPVDASVDTSVPVDSVDVNVIEESTGTTKRSGLSSSERCVKRKKSKGKGHVEDSLGTYIGMMAESVAQIASAMQNTTRHSEERKLFTELMTELSSIPSFSEEEVGSIYDNLSKNPTMIHAFLAKPTALKAAWMRKELNK